MVVGCYRVHHKSITLPDLHGSVQGSRDEGSGESEVEDADGMSNQASDKLSFRAGDIPNEYRNMGSAGYEPPIGRKAASAEETMISWRFKFDYHCPRLGISNSGNSSSTRYESSSVRCVTNARRLGVVATGSP